MQVFFPNIQYSILIIQSQTPHRQSSGYCHRGAGGIEHFKTSRFRLPADMVKRIPHQCTK
jgi:hypothetical protein